MLKKVWNNQIEHRCRWLIVTFTLIIAFAVLSLVQPALQINESTVGSDSASSSDTYAEGLSLEDQFIELDPEDEESDKPQDSRDMLMLSKRKAEKIEAWENVMKQVHEGDIVEGEVTRKIKGGLLVDIGVNVFLPASQVDIRRPSDIADFIGKPIKCVVLKIDEARRNIVVSRRALIEEERKEQKQKLLSEL